ncbi:MAG: hypothetical protein GX230_06910 [Lentisphaerae bacterium]|nr:hypothetical protein [Lentisphaerota bacterium]
MRHFADIWGGGRGIACRLRPPLRLLCGIAVFIVCIIATLNRTSLIYTLTTLTAWLLLSLPPLRRLAATAALAAVIFVPPVLLALVAALYSSTLDYTAISSTLALRGTLCMLGAVATMATLDMTDFATALEAMPLPPLLKRLLLQIVWQTALLSDETNRLSATLKLRGVSGGTAATRIRAITALPVVWLLRLINRAERVGQAMELRGFGCGVTKPTK